MSDFALSGTQRITVLVNGVPQEWAVSATLSSRTTAYGSYDLTRTSLSSGTFTANIELPVTLIFRRGGQAKTLDLGVVPLLTSSGTWTTIATSPTAALAASKLQLGVALTGTLTSTALDLSISPAHVDPNRPGPTYVDPTAAVDPGVGSLGRYCSIGAGASIAAGAVIGPHAVIGPSAHIGVDAVIGDRASIGTRVVVGDGSALSSFVVVASGCTIGAAAVLGTGANLGTATQVGDGASILGDSVLEGGCTLGNNARLGRQVRARAGATVGAGVEIASGATVPASPAQLTDIVRCILDDGSEEYRSLPTSSWPPETPPAVIQQGSSPSVAGSLAAPPIMAEHGPMDPGDPPAGYEDLADHIGKDIAPPGNGGTGQPCGDDYRCGWYAEQLRIKLESKGYDTTFTVWDRLNPDWKQGSSAPKWLRSHCLTDIHWPGGNMVFIEAQFIEGHGINARTKELDGNNDHKIAAFVGTLPDATSDGNNRIAVFESRAEAAAAGAVCNGN
ncbi:MAG: hypothetical protein HY812_09045 [Planctomycetes bacterium]|nr:hypothetical protein [Planctomycetota bacterium]